MSATVAAAVGADRRSFQQRAALFRASAEESLIREINERLVFANSYQRLPALLGQVPKSAPPGSYPWRAWCTVLGEAWSVCDNHWLYRVPVLRALRLAGPAARRMMDDQELAEFAALPDTLTLFRGCGPENIHGLSWSSSPDVARRFPFLNRYRTSNPLLVSARVEKSSVLAVKLDRNEHEVVVEVTTSQIVSSERLHGGAA